MAVAPSNLVRIRHSDSGIELQFKPDAYEFYREEKYAHFSSVQHSNVVCAVAAASPRVITHGELLTILNVAESARDKHRVHSAMHVIKAVMNKLLESRAPFPIKNLHSRGYILLPSWVRVPLGTEVSSVLGGHIDALKKLVTRCKDAVLKGTVTGPVVTQLAVDEAIVARNSGEYRAIRIAVIGAIATPGNYGLVEEVKRSIDKLSSYVEFFRIGDGLTAEQWKADYIKEIDEALANLLAAIDRAREPEVLRAA